MWPGFTSSVKLGDRDRRRGENRSKESNMPAVVDRSICAAHGECIEVCPSDAIKIENNVAVVEDDLCADCGVCEDVCPTEAITIE